MLIVVWQGCIHNCGEILIVVVHQYYQFFSNILSGADGTLQWRPIFNDYLIAYYTENDESLSRWKKYIHKLQDVLP